MIRITDRKKYYVFRVAVENESLGSVHSQASSEAFVEAREDGAVK